MKSIGAGQIACALAHCHPMLSVYAVEVRRTMLNQFNHEATKF